jgi:hypothetical protein
VIGSIVAYGKIDDMRADAFLSRIILLSMTVGKQSEFCDSRTLQGKILFALCPFESGVETEHILFLGGIAIHVTVGPQTALPTLHWI